MYFDYNDCKIYYEDTGNTDASVLIFIHGFPLDHSMWDATVGFFKKRYRIISYDIRGLGKSSTSSFPYTFEFLVDDLVALIEHLKIKNAVLIGLSMGGYIALRTMERIGDRIGRLVLCDTQAIVDNNPGLLGRHQNLLLLKEQGLDVFVDKFIHNLLSTKTLEKKADIVHKFRQTVLNQTKTGLAASLVALATRTNTTEYLSKIEIPVLLIAGQDDKVTPPDRMKEMSLKINNSEFIIIPETGHMAPMEDSEQFHKIMINFLEKNRL